MKVKVITITVGVLGKVPKKQTKSWKKWKSEKELKSSRQKYYKNPLEYQEVFEY